MEAMAIVGIYPRDQAMQNMTFITWTAAVSLPFLSQAPALPGPLLPLAGGPLLPVPGPGLPGGHLPPGAPGALGFAVGDAGGPLNDADGL